MFKIFHSYFYLCTIHTGKKKKGNIYFSQNIFLGSIIPQSTIKKITGGFWTLTVLCVSSSPSLCSLSLFSEDSDSFIFLFLVCFRSWINFISYSLIYISSPPELVVLMSLLCSFWNIQSLQFHFLAFLSMQVLIWLFTYCFVHIFFTCTGWLRMWPVECRALHVFASHENINMDREKSTKLSTIAKWLLFIIEGFYIEKPTDSVGKWILHISYQVGLHLYGKYCIDSDGVL